MCSIFRDINLYDQIVEKHPIQSKVILNLTKNSQFAMQAVFLMRIIFLTF
jgi:hypothetical protein